MTQIHSFAPIADAQANKNISLLLVKLESPRDCGTILTAHNAKGSD